MQVGYDKALVAFEGLDAERRAPTLHPYYIVADAKRSPELQPVFFVHKGKGAVYYHGFHIAPVDGTDFYDIQSPYGYGGPIASNDDVEFLAEAWEVYSSWCLENNILVEFIRFHPLLENWRYYNGEAIYDRQTVWVDLGVDDLLMTYSVRVRTAVRKATKEGLHVEWVDGDQFAKIFPRMYMETMAELNSGDFYHFNDGYFSELLNWDLGRLAVCFLGNDEVAAAIFLKDGNMMEYHLSASTPVGKKLAATNLILHEAALLGQQLGCRSLYLGGGTDSREDNSLLFFKKGFSNSRGLFKIGKLIHQPEAYSAYKDVWLGRNGAVSSRILFYRT